MAVYTTATLIANYLGLTLSGAQQTQAGVMATNASNFIEVALDRSWLSYIGTPLAVSDERHTVQGNRIWLKHTPAVAVTSISTRMRSAGATVYELDQDYQYELIEPTIGEIVFSPTYEGQRIEVDYTSSETVPAIISQFATELAAGMLILSLSGATAATSALAGVKSYTLWGGDLRVEYATANASSGESLGSTRLPALWADIERLFSRRVRVA